MGDTPDNGGSVRSAVGPTVVQVTRSWETDAVTVTAPDGDDGTQDKRSQTGKLTWVPPRNWMAAPSDERVSSSMSPVGRTSNSSVAALSLRLVRIIRPAFANDDVFCRSVTRTCSCSRLPIIGRYT